MHLKTLTALLGLIVGVTIGEIGSYGSEIAIVLGALSVTQAVLYYFEIRKRNKQEYQGDTPIYFVTPTLVLLSAILFFFVACGIMRVQFSEEKNNFVCNGSCSFTGTVVSSPKIQNDYQIFSVHPSGSSHTYDVQIKTPLYPQYSVGEEITLTGKVRLPHIMMPHSGGKEFDYEMYLRVHGIGSEMTYPKIEQKVRGKNEKGISSYLVQMKDIFVEIITRHVSEPAASLASGMLFGATTMSQELVQTFRVAGLSHIVVLSGFNIAILISFVLLVCMFMPLVLRVLLAFGFVVLFVFSVGGEASIIRATLMSFIGLAALLVGRAYTARQALLVSLFLIILYEPLHLLYDVSLHLSFLATAGIVYMSDGIKSIFKKIQSTTYKEIITTTLAAYLATLLYVMYTFQTVSLYALLTNLLVLPLVPIMMLLTSLIIVVSFISKTLAHVLGYGDTLLGNMIIGIARTIEKLPLSSLHVSLSFIDMCVLYLGLIAVYLFSVQYFTHRIKNETSHTKDDKILSEIISF